MYKQGQVGSGGPQGNIHIPFTTFQQVYNRGDSIGWFMITGKPEFDILQIEADVKLLLRNLHNVHPEDERAFGSFNLGEAFGKVTGFLTGMRRCAAQARTADKEGRRTFLRRRSR